MSDSCGISAIFIIILDNINILIKTNRTLQKIHFDTFFDPVRVINVVKYINVSNNVEKLPLFPNFKNQKKPQIGVVP